MKKIILVFALLIGLACKSGAQALLTNRQEHVFSDPLKPDVFSLSLSGKSILKGQALFLIIDHNGKQIFKEEFPSEDLLDDMKDALTPRKQVDYIKKRFDHFFDNKSFHTPAIGPSDKFYDDNANIKIWKDIRSDRKAIGFIYAHGYEGTYGIAWSKKQHKVVTFFYSD